MPTPQKLIEYAHQLLRQKNTEQALFTLMHISTTYPEFLAGHIGLALALQQRGEYGNAEEELLSCLQKAPENPDVLFSLANLYAEQGRQWEAEEVYRQLLERDPTHSHARHNYGTLLQSLGRFHEAITQYYAALEQHPEYPETWRDLGQLMLALGEANAGIEILERANARFPKERETRFALGLAYLRVGDWTHGWPLYESRRAADDPPPGPEHIPCWTGQAVKNARILITAEQGFGDCLLFARYLPQLRAVATEVSLWVQPALWRLFANSFSCLGINILTPGEPNNAFDFRLAFGSLPLAMLSEGVSSPPNNPPYLFARPENDPAIAKFVGEWQSSRPANGLSAGIIWRGRADYAADTTRSTSLESLIAQIPGEIVRLASFQADASQDEKMLLAAHHITDLSGLLNDFHASANALDAVDIIITVDTAIANLAGALGKPMIVLQRLDSDWRWGMDRTGQAWFEHVEPVLQNQI